LRDRSGIIQLVINPEKSAAAHEVADRLRSEYVIAVKGRVIARAPETVNPQLATGKIEIDVETIELINEAKNPPFFIQNDIEIDEVIRLKYRYLDLRREEMQRIMMLRHQMTAYLRNFLSAEGFLDIETPVLTKSTPEGARDYLVPSRVQPGHFFALPQSPQLFKQLLMVAGFERYYQITRCFRDEDLRADRQPEFTQLDVEMSFMPLAEFHDLIEEMMAGLVEETIGYQCERPFARMTYREAMERFGSDKPDLRFGMELTDISEIVRDCNFNVFSNVVKSGGQVKGINAKGCAFYSRKDVDNLTAYVADYGAKGLAWLAVGEDELRGPLAKMLSAEELARVQAVMAAEVGDLLLFVADKKSTVAAALGALRLELGKRTELIPAGTFKFAWITDFPLFEYSEEDKRYVAAHHPFTMPKEEDIAIMESDPANTRAQSYDLVLNGYELGSGSLRIYKRELQERMFRVLGFTPEQTKEQFGFLLEAFEYGTPPHGGIALGIDRLVMILAGRDNLRDTIAFPKTSSASCLLTGAPSVVDPKQLRELNLEVKLPSKKES
ncbi:MAG: aspartate--tRNA ligase, partial [Anaerovoracaceae bacterium]